MRNGRRGVLQVLMFGLGLGGVVGCGADPCVVLVQETCGSDDACASVSACVSARDMSRRGVTEACESARDNAISFPDCRS
ncbi:MAG: hypothetical protein ABIJ09_03460 [Pseudomonadota bacterium]